MHRNEFKWVNPIKCTSYRKWFFALRPNMFHANGGETVRKFSFPEKQNQKKIRMYCCWQFFTNFCNNNNSLWLETSFILNIQSFFPWTIVQTRETDKNTPSNGGTIRRSQFSSLRVFNSIYLIFIYIASWDVLMLWRVSR